MRFGSVCSGIEAASVAFNPIGWEAAWLAEVDIAASAVLAHRFGASAPVYPLEGSERALKKIAWRDRVTNWGDMTKLPDLVRSGVAEAPDVLCGGTPCQSFSLAGRREGLTDGRGQLTLSFVDLADVIDTKRAERGEQPCIIFWENVPGVLSDKTNAFGCFLAALAGESEPLEPAGPKWSNAGAVFGPQRTVAWRVLDAQYFGVAQRRRRVFVVASARDGFDPCEVLFERKGVRRDTAPSREAGQNTSSTIRAGVAGSLRATDGGADVDHARAGHLISEHQRGYRMVAFGEYADDNTASAMKARDYKDATDLAVSVNGDLTHTLTGEGFDASEDGTGRGVSTIAFSSKDYGADAAHDLSPTLRAGGHADSHANAGVPPACTVALPMNTQIITRGGALGRNTGFGLGDQNDPMFTLQAGHHHAVAHSVALRGREGGATAELGGEVATALRASSGGGDKPHVLAFHINAQASQLPTADRDTSISDSLTCSQLAGVAMQEVVGFQSSHSGVRLVDTHATLDANNGPRRHNGVVQAMAVRRLTPTECSRLQGFPDDHARVPIGNALAADGPIYKQLGNSWAVPTVAWIGRRIQVQLESDVPTMHVWLLAP